MLFMPLPILPLKPVGAVMKLPMFIPGIMPGAGIIAIGPAVFIPIPGNMKFKSMSSGRFISSSALLSSFFLMSSVDF